MAKVAEQVEKNIIKLIGFKTLSWLFHTLRGQASIPLARASLVCQPIGEHIHEIPLFLLVDT